MITIAIIGILSLLALPFYNQYIVRVENTRVLTDLSYIARKIQLDAMVGEFGASEYSADKLLSIAPNPFISKNNFGCAAAGYRLHRLQWNDPVSIAKILNNHTSKIATLHIETFMKDPTCTGPHPNQVTQQTMFFALDYKAYGLNPPKETPVRTYADGGAIFLILSGEINYADDKGNIKRTVVDDHNLVCAVSNGSGVRGLVATPAFPLSCSIL